MTELDISVRGDGVLYLCDGLTLYMQLSAVCCLLT